MICKYSSQSAAETEGMDAKWKDWLRVETSSEDSIAFELWVRGLPSNVGVIEISE